MRGLTALRLPRLSPGKRRAKGRRKIAGMRALVRPALWALPPFAAVAGAAWFWFAGPLPAILAQAWDGAIATTADAGFYIGEVYLEGREHTPRAAIVKELNLDRGAPILAFSPDDARRKLEALGWVQEATVSRHLPDTIRIRLVERVPFAIWQRDGDFVLIDSKGDEIAGARVDRHVDLPLIVGADAAHHATELVTMLSAEPDLAARVTAAVRIGGRRWDLRLDGAVVVKLPETDAGAAWSRLAAMDRESALLARNVLGIDLRLPDRLIVRVPENVAPKRETVPEGGGTATTVAHET
ncbi:MAG: FtsQ-type POTRA domain-containing protein [Rhodospirillaceae bacterium]|jgi:cell division protein FtsQ|nr:FtsQ-type POTRA domain-containing protein [Rhodospirillaceae bacterium]MBT6117382.1 FtsQ-type POTRA domain-containing protein [Rhodospirillaceae bacterium]